MSRLLGSRSDAAHHEAGHAVACVILTGEVGEIVLRPPMFPGRVEDWRGYTVVPGDTAAAHKAVIGLAGPIAEARFRGHTPDVEADERDEWNEALEECASARVSPAETLAEALALVEEAWQCVSAVADALVRDGSLDGVDAAALVAANRHS